MTKNTTEPKTLEEQFDESMIKIKGIRDNDSFFEMIAYEKPKSLEDLSFEKKKKMECFGREEEFFFEEIVK